MVCQQWTGGEPSLPVSRCWAKSVTGFLQPFDNCQETEALLQARSSQHLNLLPLHCKPLSEMTGLVQSLTEQQRSVLRTPALVPTDETLCGLIKTIADRWAHASPAEKRARTPTDAASSISTQPAPPAAAAAALFQRSHSHSSASTLDLGHSNLGRSASTLSPPPGADPPSPQPHGQFRTPALPALAPPSGEITIPYQVFEAPVSDTVVNVVIRSEWPPGLCHISKWTVSVAFSQASDSWLLKIRYPISYQHLRVCPAGANLLQEFGLGETSTSDYRTVVFAVPRCAIEAKRLKLSEEPSGVLVIQYAAAAQLVDHFVPLGETTGESQPPEVHQ